MEKFKKIAAVFVISIVCMGMTACVNINISIGDDDENHKTEQQSADNQPELSRDEVVAIILERADGATEDSIISFETDYDDGRWIYEGDVVVNDMVFEFEIDGDNGNILEWEYDD